MITMRVVPVLFMSGLLIACGGKKGSSAPPATGNSSSGAAVAGGPCGKGEFTGCEARCAANDGESCLSLGMARVLGALPGGKAGAMAAFEKGCSLKVGAACENLGTALINGWNGRPDTVRAFQLQQEACDIGSANGCYNLANYYFGGVGTTQDPQKTVGLLASRVCRAREWEKVGAMENPNEGLDATILLLKGCKMLGKLYATGTGTERDLEKAHALLSLVCQMGSKIPPDVHLNNFTYQDACDGARILEEGQ